MKVISPGHHPTADKFWRKQLKCNPNGARTLGSAMAKYFPPLLENYFDMMVCYSASFSFDIPEGTRRIAVFGHQNFPPTEGFRVWQKVNAKLKGYEVIYFYNDPTMVKMINEFGRAYLLPRFLDTDDYPTIKAGKIFDTLWLGNVWDSVQGMFDAYKETATYPYWVSKGVFGFRDMEIKQVNREETLRLLAQTKTAWAIGISQLEARLYGCDVVPYKDGVLPFYDQHTILPYLQRLLDEIGPK